MGAVVYHFISLHSFVMGVMWFNVLVLLGVIMRKLKFPIRFSTLPLFVLLVATVLRMFIVVERPGSIIILSETIYPAIINLSRLEFTSRHIFGFPINTFNLFICIWVIVTVVLIVRYAILLYKSRHEMRLYERLPRDLNTELILADMIGEDKYVRVFRSKSVGIPFAAGFKNPYIVIPDVDLPIKELRMILLHEWKHIKDKDILAGHIVCILCYFFWWNPLVYVLRRNFSFARELKADLFAVPCRKDLIHYLQAIHNIGTAHLKKRKPSGDKSGNTLVNEIDETLDRIKVLYIKGDSRPKRILTNIVFSVITLALFVTSYMFLIQPAFWDNPDVPTTVAFDVFIEDYEDGDVYKAGETFIVDNGDGTFSLYINGQFVQYVDGTSDVFGHLQIRQRESD